MPFLHKWLPVFMWKNCMLRCSFLTCVISADQLSSIDISQILNQRNQNVNQVNDPWINSWITNQKPAFPKWTHVIGMIGFVGHLVSGKLSRELIVRFREGSGCFRINKCRICWQFTWYLCFQVYSYNYCHSKYIAVKFTCHFCMFSGFG